MSFKVAILGGSFNPIHNGHILLGVKAFEQFGLDKILVMPNKSAYYKKNEMVSDEHRENMTRLAILPYEYMEYSGIEIERGGVTYTYDTLVELNEIFERDGISAEMYFIIGGDSLAYLDKWYKAEELFTMTTFLVACRDDVDEAETKKIIDDLKCRFSGCDIRVIRMDNVAISSSLIRQRVALGENIDDLVSPLVSDYIKKNNLYR